MRSFVKTKEYAKADYQFQPVVLKGSYIVCEGATVVAVLRWMRSHSATCNICGIMKLMESHVLPFVS